MADRKKPQKLAGGRWSKVDIFQVVMSSRPLAWLAVVLLAMIVSLVSTMSLQHIPAYMQEGMIAPRDIKADRSYEVVDEEATDALKLESLNSIMPVYDIDPLVAESVSERIRLAFANARLKTVTEPHTQKQNLKKSDDTSATEEGGEAEKIFIESLGVTPTSEQWKALSSDRFSEATESYVVNLFNKAMDRPVVAEKISTESDSIKGIIVRRIVDTGTVGATNYHESVIKNPEELLSVAEVKKMIPKLDVPSYGLARKSAVPALESLVADLILHNCMLNRTETQLRRDQAISSVKNVIIKIKAGEMIIREGSRYEPWHIKVLTGIKKEKMKGMYPVELLGTFLLALIFLVVPSYLAEKFFIRARSTASDNVLMALVGISVLVLVRLLLEAGPVIQNAFFYGVPDKALAYAIPLAGGAMLVRMYLNAEISVIFAVIMSSFVSMMVKEDVSFGVFCLITNLAAVIAVSRADRRSTIMKAGAVAGVVGMFTVLATTLVNMASAASSIFMSDALWYMVMAMLGGIGSALFALIGSAVVDSVSDYISDIKLLELANLNHPLLRELIVMAPGTYHHSHLVGVLAEAAADSIGANSLLVRVAAYYHDIGKMKKPQYFIENVKGDNKHEKISAHMSALVVAAHVKDGIEMARKAKIPRVILDMIPEHHGTRVMQYFYSKAKESGDLEAGGVSEKDFRYDGPKPQSAEAAILMLADATEASVRSLKEKGSTRIQQTVQKVINDIFVESQLDECDLTLRDLNEISKAFVRILLGIYHQRIEYPRDDETKTEGVAVIGESDRENDIPLERTSDKTG